MEHPPTRPNRITLHALIGIVLLIGIGLTIAASGRHEPVRAMFHRVPWTSGRVVGTPDPPLPYRTERLFPRLTFKNPLDIAFPPGSDRVFVVEQAGRILSFPNVASPRSADVVLDLPNEIRGLDRVPFCKGIEAAYGLTFHPQFARNHYCYVCYTLAFREKNHNQLGSRVSRFTVTGDPPKADPASEVVMLQWLSGGHNGGCVKFGKDGCLYVSTGDGGDPNPPDPFDTGQRVDDLLSSILRIDVDHPDPGKTYGIPKDNPFLNVPGARGEVWAFGLRNPWRMNFDRQTGELWVGDVGWELWEMVHRVRRGGNYGWSIMEGPNPVHPNEKPGPAPITPPQLALSHTESSSITGGVMYRGSKLPQLRGQYVFGDWETRRLWASAYDGTRLAPHRSIAQTDQRIVAFGEDANGEVYIVDHEGGGIWQIVPSDAASESQPFPRTLSETGLFSSVPQQTPVPGVLPFAINAPQWVDGASETHFVAIPGTQRAYIGKGTWGEDKAMYPKNTVLVRTLSLPMKADDARTQKKIETQLLHFDGRQWHGYSYRWNEQQTDAMLLPAEGLDEPLNIDDPTAPGGHRRQVWHYPSRAQCLTCHTTWTSYLMALTDQQLDHDQALAPGVSENVKDAFRREGLLAPPLPPPPDPKDAPPPYKKLTNPHDETASLDDRARSYLHVNCSHCHRFGGGGSALIDVRRELPINDTHLLTPPLLGAFGMDDPRIVATGDPARSVLFFRMNKAGNGHMPHIGSNVTDERGVKLIGDWIASLGPSTPDVLPSTPQAAEELLASASGALKLVRAMEHNGLPEPVRAQVVSKGVNSSQLAVHDLFVRFDPSHQNADRLGTTFDRAKLLARPGSGDAGRKIFFDLNGTGLCARCHMVNGKGADFGPDLSHIASKYNPSDLLDNIVEPSRTIDPKFVNYLAQTTDGQVHQGLLVSRTDDQIVLKDPELKETRLPAAQVKRLVPQKISAMPEGLLSELEPQQAADLLAFLRALK